MSPIAQGLEARAEGFHSAFRIWNKDWRRTIEWWGETPINPSYNSRKIKKDQKFRVPKEKEVWIGGGDTPPTPL